MKYYVYMLYCADGTLYTGSTNDPKKRVTKHNRKRGAKYTRNRTPVQLVYLEEVEDKSTALKREHQIKQLSRFEKLSLIDPKLNIE